MGCTVGTLPNITPLWASSQQCCGSHLQEPMESPLHLWLPSLCSALLCGTLIGVYFSPTSFHTAQKDTAAAAMYAVVTPMPDPFIYTLRNRDIKGAPGTLIQGRQSLLGSHRTGSAEGQKLCPDVHLASVHQLLYSSKVVYRRVVCFRFGVSVCECVCEKDRVCVLVCVLVCVHFCISLCECVYVCCLWV